MPRRKLSLDAFKQALMQETARWVAELFGEAAANALFTVNGGAAFVGGNLQAGTIQLGGLVGTALAWVMTAYMIYAIAVILIQLIWTCEQEEFELGAKRELRSCHDLGSYCKTKVLSACIERRKAYCCFNTPLARILNEQIRPQLGRGWGEADQPDCTGHQRPGLRAGRLGPGEPRRVAGDPGGDGAFSRRSTA